MEDEAASRAYISQMWAEAMEIYRSGRYKLSFSPAMQRYLKEHQRDFMPEDTFEKIGMKGREKYDPNAGKSFLHPGRQANIIYDGKVVGLILV